MFEGSMAGDSASVTILPEAKMPACSMRHAVAVTCALFHMQPEELLSPARDSGTALPRQFSMALCRELGRSYPQVGRFYDRDHTTVLSAERRVIEHRAHSPAWESCWQTGKGYLRNRAAFERDREIGLSLTLFFRLQPNRKKQRVGTKHRNAVAGIIAGRSAGRRARPPLHYTWYA